MATTAQMNASLILRLQDGISAGLGRLRDRLQGIRAAAERIGALGAIGSGLALGLPIQQAAALDQQLRNIAITAGLQGRAAEDYITRLRKQVQALAIATAQSSQDVAAAAAVMIARGMPRELIDKMLPTVATAALAAGASVKDLAAVVFELNAQLGISPTDLPRAMAMLVQSGKEGKVELRDMAKEFPALLAGASNFGLKGMEGLKVLGAAVQISAQAAGTPGEAANNLRNLFSELNSSHTVDRFKKEFGVDFPRMIKQALATDIPTLEAAIAKIRKVTGGDQFRLGKLIINQQARDALLPFMRSLEKYVEIRAKLADTDPKLLADDEQTQLQGAAAQVAIITERLEQLSERFGRELFSRVGGLASLVALLSAAVEYTDALAPELFGNLARVVAGSLALMAALGTLVTVLPILGAGLRLIALPVLALLKLFWSGGAALAVLVTGLRAALFVLAPVAAVIALIGGVAYTIWDNWADFRALFLGLWQAARRMLDGFIGFLDGVFSLDMARTVAGLKELWGGLRDMFVGIWAIMSKVMDVWIDGATAWITKQVEPLVAAFKVAWSDVTAWFVGIWAIMSKVMDVWVDGAAAWITKRVEPLVAAFKAAWSDVTAWFYGLVNEWMAPINTFITRVEEIYGRVRRLFPGATTEPGGPATPQDFIPPATGLSGRVEIIVSAEPGSFINDVRYPAAWKAMIKNPADPDRGDALNRA